MGIKLIYMYIGDGSALPGLPARDLTEEEIKASPYSLAQVKASGLYQPAGSIEVKVQAGKPAEQKEK